MLLQPKSSSKGPDNAVDEVIETIFSRLDDVTALADSVCTAAFFQVLFRDCICLETMCRYLSFHPMAQCVVHARSKAWLAAPVLLAHAEVTKNILFFQWVQNLGTPRYVCALCRRVWMLTNSLVQCCLPWLHTAKCWTTCFAQLIESRCRMFFASFVCLLSVC
jgi:hypothetical protein